MYSKWLNRSHNMSTKKTEIKKVVIVQSNIKKLSKSGGLVCLEDFGQLFSNFAPLQLFEFPFSRFTSCDLCIYFEYIKIYILWHRMWPPPLALEMFVITVHRVVGHFFFFSNFPPLLLRSWNKYWRTFPRVMEENTPSMNNVYTPE